MDAKYKAELEANNLRIKDLLVDVGIVFDDTNLTYFKGKPGFFGLGEIMLAPLAGIVNNIKDDAATHLFSHIVRDSYVNNIKLFAEWINADIHKECKVHEAFKKSGVFDVAKLGAVRATLFLWPFADGFEYFLPRYVALQSLSVGKNLDELLGNEPKGATIKSLFASPMRDNKEEDSLVELLADLLK